MMLFCKDCNYYKSYLSIVGTCCSDSPSRRKKGICELTRYVFLEDPEDLDIEYPCCTI